MSIILAIDQSTSATKAILFDAAGQPLGRSSREHRQIYPRAGWVEHDAEEIWNNTRAVIAELRQQHPQAIAQLAAISITNQRETIVIFDRATGKPLHNAIVWQCRRGSDICQQLLSAGHEQLVQGKTGLKIDTYFSASKLTWLVREHPHLAQRLRDGDALIGTIDTYLLYRLTNGRTFATDHTNASRTLLFDIGQLRWDESLCDLFKVPMPALPQVRECISTFGQTDAGGLLPRQVPIVGILGDSQAALFAQRCYAPGSAKATFGTGTSILLNTGHHWRPPSGGAVAALAWVCHGKPTYALEGIINYSAATIAWLKDQLGIIRDASDAEAMATAVPDTDGVYLVPAFAGLSAPYWNTTARAAIVGMNASTNKNHLVRAALESIAYQIRDVLQTLRLDAEVPLLRLNADGGPTTNSFLMQFTADITAVECVVSQMPEASALGSAMAAMLGLGIHPDLAALAKLPTASRTYTPAMPADRAALLYRGWQQAVRRVL